MALDLFDFPYHTPQDEYPGGSTIKFGRGYRFAARPPGPDEVIVHLNFPVMFIYQSTAGGPPNLTVDPQLNVYALETFYQKVRMFTPFNWVHPRLGLSIVRFNKPLTMPKTIKSSPGEVGGKVVGGVPYRIHQVEAFDLEFLLQPATGS